MASILQSGVAVESIDFVRPSLEAVFGALTGLPSNEPVPSGGTSQ